MNPEKIIEADRNFIHKLHQLRSTLDARQKENETRLSNPVYIRPIVLIFFLLVIAGVAYAILDQQQDVFLTDTRQGTSQAENVPVLHSQAASPNVEFSPNLDHRRFESHIDGDLSATQATNTPPGKLPDVPGENDKSKILSADEPLGHAGLVLQDSDGTGIQVVSAVVCKSVQNRMPLDDHDVFYTSSTSRAYVWMDVRSKEEPFVIKHIYYLNDRKYCEVPLDIRHPRMRTWSYVTLQNKDQTGPWRVEIVSNDRVMKTVRFIVRDGNDT